MADDFILDAASRLAIEAIGHKMGEEFIRRARQKAPYDATNQGRHLRDQFQVNFVQIVGDTLTVLIDSRTEYRAVETPVLKGRRGARYFGSRTGRRYDEYQNNGYAAGGRYYSRRAGRYIKSPGGSGNQFWDNTIREIPQIIAQFSGLL